MAKIKTRARAVDMLGRQQIATVQNALAELFKNAHDAYADSVLVDFFENEGPGEEGVLVIRDDGVGMTREDFEEKWLVLGTESKLGGRSRQHFRPPSKVERPVTGEKGIGRLAIALLGSQVFIMSRAQRADGFHDLVIGWLHWGLFSVPGVNLDDIEIPVATVNGGELPSTSDIEKLRGELIAGVEALEEQHEESKLNLSEIKKQIKLFDPKPKIYDQFLNTRADRHASISGDGSGTVFIIAPANPVIQLELNDEEKEQDYGFRKKLMGFSDCVFGRGDEPVIDPSFCRWAKGAISGEEYLDSELFFSKEELTERSDHFLQGQVDKFGQFKGLLRVYDTEYEDLVIPWSGNQNKQTQCGSFSVVFGYLQGTQKESMVPSDEWVEMNRKLDHLGGIYIYRDSIRILPYGDHAFDWLEVEKRRNKSASYYFFSFRRMFGAVLLSREENGALEEKAGREGLQANGAYRELKSILTNLLLKLASDFFRKGGENAEVYELDKSARKRKADALDRAKKRKRDKKDAFEKDIQKFTSLIADRAAEKQIEILRDRTRDKMLAASGIEDQDKAAAHLIKTEKEAMEKISELRNRFTLRKPTGVHLGNRLEDEWQACLNERAGLEKTLFEPLEREISQTLGEVAEQARIYIDQRKRLEERLKAIQKERKDQLESASTEAKSMASDARKAVTSISEKARLALDETIRNIEADLNRTQISEMDSNQIDSLRVNWERQLTDIEEHHRDGLLAARDMLASLAANLMESDGAAPAELMEAMDERMEALEEQAGQDFEMVQLGLAISIINHEFAAAIKQIRHSVRDLGNVSRRSGALKPIYESIRDNFEHLDGHLKLFTPLQRRLHRKPVKITGKAIRNYINDVFQNRLHRHNVCIESTEAFLNISIICYPSALYPALVNIVDNAIYWVGETPGDSTIRLDADVEGITIANNGLSIPERDRSRIFERGYSRKPNGRGLGCFISAKALEQEDMTLSLAPATEEFPVSFRITFPDDVST